MAPLWLAHAEGPHCRRPEGLVGQAPGSGARKPARGWTILLSPVYTSGEKSASTCGRAAEHQGPHLRRNPRRPSWVAELDRRCARLTFGVGAGAYVDLRPAGARARRSRKLAIRALSGHNVPHRGSPGARLEMPLRVLGVGVSAFHADGERGLAEVSRCTRAGVASKRPIGTRPGMGKLPSFSARRIASPGIPRIRPGRRARPGLRLDARTRAPTHRSDRKLVLRGQPTASHSRRTRADWRDCALLQRGARGLRNVRAIGAGGLRKLPKHVVVNGGRDCRCLIRYR